MALFRKKPLEDDANKSIADLTKSTMSDQIMIMTNKRKETHLKTLIHTTSLQANAYSLRKHDHCRGAGRLQAAP
jgi:hypothetical protein